MNLLYLIGITDVFSPLKLPNKPLKVDATCHKTRLRDLLPLFVLTDSDYVSVCLLCSSSECMSPFPKNASIHLILAVSYS